MRACLLLTLLVLGCGETARPPTVGGDQNGSIGDIGILNPGSGTGGVGGIGGVGGSGGVGGGFIGACVNESDLATLASAGRVRDVARDCGLFVCPGLAGGNDAYEACVLTCVEDDVSGISTECASCYAAVERCSTGAFCQARCQLNNCSVFCLSCLEDAGCIDAFETCRGLEGDECG